MHYRRAGQSELYSRRVTIVRVGNIGNREESPDLIDGLCSGESQEYCDTSIIILPINPTGKVQTFYPQGSTVLNLEISLKYRRSIKT